MKKKLLVFLFSVFSIALPAQAPTGYYSGAEGLSGAELKTALYNIIKDHTVRTYDQLWTDFQTTDATADGKVWDMYSNCSFTFVSDQCGSYSNECDCYNREHSFPKSWFNDATPMYTDLFHLVPTDGKVNGMRSNYPFGEVASPTYTSGNGSKLGSCSYPGYSGTVFEPVDEYKGDFARAYFYMATRYENVIAGWYSNSTEADAILQNNSFPVFEDWFLNMLGEWSENDPVSQKEIDRNNAVYSIQHNRNPFIDHPEYVYAIWGVGGSPSPVPEPAGYPAGFSAHNIKLHWVDATGDIVPTGYLIEWSSTGFNDITAPSDGTFVDDGETSLNVAAGEQAALIRNLAPSTTYYFKIFGYVGTGSSVDYKTDGEVPQTSQSTSP